MEKNKYYVSVQSRSIMFDKGQASYELEIEATESEVKHLQSKFDELEEADHATFFRTFTPGLPYHHDPQNDEYDRALKDCYNLIFQLGTDETRVHLSSFVNNLQMGHYQEEL
ncbi:hypothetical protein [Cohnella panacarvi]|uniref:hypothetical protein n=1 Tax=Cohnella panacarvi TaxID=400776 RepID=UPI00047DDCC0|nr:hypothetical protein [Cohnella panacarvi]